MNRTDRLTGLTLELRGGQRTASELAARFEVSRRTILRDIDALSQLGIPIVALPGPNGGYRLPDDYWLPPLHFTDEEATALLFALQHLGDGETSPLGDARRTAEQKLRAAIPAGVLAATEARLRHLAVLPSDRAPDAAIVRTVREAVEENTWLQIDYRSLRADSTRAILPREVWVAEGRWYTTALDAKSGERRVFRLDRMDGIRRVPPPSNADEILTRDSVTGRDYGDPSHPEIVIQLTERGRRLAHDLPDINRLTPDEPAAGTLLRWRCPPTELPYYAQLLTRLGPEVTVIAPDEVRMMLIAQSRALLEHHERHQASRNGDRTVSLLP